ncbi:aromatic ring-hydroxylating dioxygenase subunit alpha [Synechococcus sp. R55.6]|uniref:aromatic ring-hydroxylating oxygenase subunit alpha n=1 Tax=unclassified Synechococcus TaxID=2626047 RepID=UPI0039C484BE
MVQSQHAVLDLDFLIQLGQVHRSLYTDPEVFALEMKRVFGVTWVYLAHESEFPQPGCFLRRRLGTRPILLTRERDGQVYGLFNRCTHRGTLLVTQDKGSAKHLSCPYHGWCFALDGRLKNLPVAQSYANPDKPTFNLGQLQVESYRGFVFGTLAAEPLPLTEWLGAARPWLDEHLDRHPGGQIRVLDSPIHLEFKGNWKLLWDNAADGIHATFAHRSYNLLGHQAETETVLARNPAKTPMVSRTLGHGHCVVDQRPGLPDGPWATMRQLPTREALERSLCARGEAYAELLNLATGNMVNLSLFPNLILVGNQLMVVEPLAVDRTRISLYLAVAEGVPQEINLLRLRVDEDFVSFGTPDDLAIFERIQEGLEIPEEEWLDISRGHQAGDQLDPWGNIVGSIATEAPIRAYWQEWKRLMREPIPLRVRRASEQRPANLTSPQQKAADFT